MPAPTRTKEATASRREGLVRAALALAAQGSPAEVTTGALAAAIGITQGGVFKHFPSKEDIWLAALDWAQADLLARLNEAAARHAAPGQTLQALRAVFMAHIIFVREYPGLPRIVFQELQHPRPTALKAGVQALMTRYRELVAGLLARAREEGALSPRVDLAGAALLFLGAVQGIVMQSLMSGSLQSTQAQAESVFAIVEAGLVAAPDVQES